MSVTDRDDWVRVDPLEDIPPYIDRIDTESDQVVDEWPAAEPWPGMDTDWKIPDERTNALNARYSTTLTTKYGIEWIDLHPDGGGAEDAPIIISERGMVDLEGWV